MKSPLVFKALVLFVTTATAGCGMASVPGASSGSRRSELPASSSSALSRSTSPVAAPSIRPAACRAQDLGARFQGGEYGTGSDMGSIQIWNVGASPCLLAGAITFAASFANGVIDANAHRNQPLPPLSATLPAHMPPPKEGADPTEYLVASLDGPERDDPAQPSGLCRRQDELTPDILELSIGDVTLVVSNQDDAPAGLGQIHAVYGCHGLVLLEDVTPPAGQ